MHTYIHAYAASLCINAACCVLESLHVTIDYTDCMVFLSLQLAWKTLYGKSSKDFCTLSFFKRYLHCSSVTKIAKKAIDANIELFLTVVKGHILACACNLLGCGSVDDSLQLPSGILRASRKQKREYIRQVSSQIVDVCTIVDISNYVIDTEDKVYYPGWKDTRIFVMHPYLCVRAPINAICLIFMRDLRACVN